MHLFSNKKTEYEDFLPITSSDLEFKKSEEGNIFDIEKSIVLKPGLYYYVVEDENEKIHFVQKFEVRLLFDSK